MAEERGIPIVNVNTNCYTGSSPLYLARALVAGGLYGCVLRGEAANRQVDDVDLALQHNIGLGGAAVVTLYRRAS